MHQRTQTDHPSDCPVRAAASQQHRHTTALLLLNGVLLAVLAALVLPSVRPGAVFTPASARAQSQPGGPDPRPRGDYLLLGGEISGGSANAIWVVDGANQEMIALRWNQGRSGLQGLGYRDLRADLNPRAER